MATIRLLDKFCKHNKHLFIKATTTPEVLIGGLSKAYIEHQLLCFELGTYITIPNLIMSPFVDVLISPIILYNLIMVPACIVVPYAIPGYRIYNAFENKTIEIIDWKL